MRGLGKVNVAPRDGFPPFPTHYLPCRPHLTAMFIRDYWENKPHICDRMEHCYLETVITVILFPYYFMVVSLYQQ